jgi:hypothetical protein
VLQRHIVITVLATIFLLIPPGLVIFLVVRSQGSFEMAASAITLNLLIVAIGTYIVGLGLWRVRPWGFFALFVFSACIIGYNVYKMLSESQQLDQWDIAILVGITVAMALSLRRQVSAAYFNPRLRWWERAERVQVNLEVELEIDGNKKRVPVLDISNTGIFVKLDGLQAGDSMGVHLVVADFTIDAMAKAIRIAPNGTGLMFVDLNWSTSRDLKRLIKYLQNLAAEGSTVAAPTASKG